MQGGSRTGTSLGRGPVTGGIHKVRDRIQKKKEWLQIKKNIINCADVH